MREGRPVIEKNKEYLAVLLVFGSRSIFFFLFGVLLLFHPI